VLFLTDRRSESLDALEQRARELGLRARMVPIGEALDMDLSFQALSTTHASWPALRALFAARGVTLDTRAWLRSEIETLGLDLTNVHGLQWAPLSERTLGLSPGAHRALVLQKPDRVIH
jgi:hypothetical protein